MAEHLRVERDGPVLRLTLDKPGRMNAVDASMVGAATAELEALGDPTAEGAVRVVVVTGAGESFSAGADLQVTVGQDPEATMDGAHRLIRAVVAAPVPVVARVNGPAAGFGASLALACDLTYAVTSAYLLQAFVHVGLMPDGGASALLAASVGRARANEMILLGERIPAPVAAKAGLVAAAYPTVEELDARVQAAVTSLLAASPTALARTKAALNAHALAGLDAALDREKDGQVVLLAGEDFRRRAEALTSRGRGGSPG